MSSSNANATPQNRTRDCLSWKKKSTGHSSNRTHESHSVFTSAGRTPTTLLTDEMLTNIAKTLAGGKTGRLRLGGPKSVKGEEQIGPTRRVADVPHVDHRAAVFCRLQLHFYCSLAGYRIHWISLRRITCRIAFHHIPILLVSFRSNRKRNACALLTFMQLNFTILRGLLGRI